MRQNAHPHSPDEIALTADSERMPAVPEIESKFNPTENQNGRPALWEMAVPIP
jgi:hypothetical protein